MLTKGIRDVTFDIIAQPLGKADSSNDQISFSSETLKDVMGFYMKNTKLPPSVKSSVFNLNMLNESKAFSGLGPMAAHRHDTASPAEPGKVYTCLNLPRQDGLTRKNTPTQANLMRPRSHSLATFTSLNLRGRINLLSLSKTLSGPG